jgi:hypothetical protein
MTHKHCHCKHELKHCDHCDVVYCTKCDKEWMQHPYSYNIGGWTCAGTTLYADGSSVTAANTSCNHNQ